MGQGSGRCLGLGWVVGCGLWSVVWLGLRVVGCRV